MNCKELEELLSAYADGELARTQREFLEEHLAGCAHCQTVLADYTKARSQLATLRTTPPVPDIRERTMLRIRGTNLSSKHRPWLRPALAALSTIAVLAVILVLQPWNSLRGPESVIARAYAATANLRSFRVEGSYNVTSGNESHLVSHELAYASPDRYHVKWTEDGTLKETIGIGDRVFIFGQEWPGGGPGPRLANTARTSISRIVPSREETLKLLESLINLERLPDETVDGVVCFRYRGEIDMARGYEEQLSKLDPNSFTYEAMKQTIEQQYGWLRRWKNEVEVWIGKDDYLLRKESRFTQVPPFDADDAGNTMTMDMRYYDFNQPVVVEPPLTSSGELLPGWRLFNMWNEQPTPVLSSDMAITVGGTDPARQQIGLTITVKNISDGSIKMVGITIDTMVHNERQGKVTMKARPSLPERVDLAPGETETYSVVWEYDASGTAKEELSRLLDLTEVTAKFIDSDGNEKVQDLSPEKP